MTTSGLLTHEVTIMQVQEAGRKALGTEVGSTCLAARTDDELRSLLLQGLDRSVGACRCMLSMSLAMLPLGMHMS